MKKDIVEKLLNLALSDESASCSSEIPFQVGEKFLFRTVTYFATGQVKKVVGKFLLLEDAAWVADTGVFSEAIAKGVLNEVEPVEEMWLNTDTITDAFKWTHKLPREKK